MKIEDLSTLKINVMKSQDQYLTAQENGLINANEIYLTPEEEIELNNYITKEEFIAFKFYHLGTDEPNNKNLLWIDTNE